MKRKILYMPAHTSNELVNIHEVARLLGVHTSTVRRYVRRGVIPRPISLSRNTQRWRKKDIQNIVLDEIEKANKDMS